MAAEVGMAVEAATAAEVISVTADQECDARRGGCPRLAGAG